MNDEQREMALHMARRVLAEENPSAMRRKWANDLVAWMERGDMAAAARCGYTETTEERRAA